MHTHTQAQTNSVKTRMKRLNTQAKKKKYCQMKNISVISFCKPYISTYIYIYFRQRFQKRKKISVSCSLILHMFISKKKKICSMDIENSATLLWDHWLLSGKQNGHHQNVKYFGYLFLTVQNTFFFVDGWIFFRLNSEEFHLNSK